MGTLAVLIMLAFTQKVNWYTLSCNKQACLSIQIHKLNTFCKAARALLGQIIHIKRVKGKSGSILTNTLAYYILLVKSIYAIEDCSKSSQMYLNQLQNLAVLILLDFTQKVN